MIVTLTANPSLDRTVELDGALEPGAVQRATSTRQDPGGKGVNVTRALRASGVESVAVLPAEPGDPFLAALAAEGVPCRAVPIRGAVRTNLTIVDAAGVTTKVNEPGPVLDADAQARLIEVTADAAIGADWLVLAGSLPPGVADDFYVRVVEAVARRGTAGRHGGAAHRGRHLGRRAPRARRRRRRHRPHQAERRGARRAARRVRRGRPRGRPRRGDRPRPLHSPRIACGRAWSRSAPSAPRSSPRRPRGSRGLPA